MIATLQLTEKNKIFGQNRTDYPKNLLWGAGAVLKNSEKNKIFGYNRTTYLKILLRGASAIEIWCIGKAAFYTFHTKWCNRQQKWRNRQRYFFLFFFHAISFLI